MDMGPAERAPRVPGYSGLRSAWRSELSPRANKVKGTEERFTELIRIEEVDVSAHVVDLPLKEDSEFRNDEVSALSTDAERVPNWTEGPRFVAVDLGAKLAADGIGMSDEKREVCMETGSGLDMHSKADLSRPSAINTHNSVQQLGSPNSEVFPRPPGMPNGHPARLSHQRSASFGHPPAKRERSPSRVSPHTRPHIISDPCIKPAPSYRSKTPPRLVVSLKREDKPLSPTQSLPSIKHGVYGSRVSEGRFRKELVIDVPPVLENHTGKANGIRHEDGRQHIMDGYMSESGQVCPLCY